MTVDVTVIGGGISGLSVAFGLMRRGHRVVVLERQVVEGGNAVSERLGGFLMEHGPSTVAAAALAPAALASDLGLDRWRCNLGDDVRRRYLVKDAKLAGISVQPLGLLTSGYLSLGARLRLMAELAVPRGGGDETIAEFATRRFGSEFAERVMDPLVGGIYAGRAEELSMTALFPRLVNMEREYGSVLLGLLRRRPGRVAMPGSRLFSWRDGIATLPRALAAALGSAVCTNVAVRAVRSSGRGFIVDAGRAGKLRTDAVVIAAQPHMTAQLLEGVDVVTAGTVAEIAAPPLAVVFLGYHRRDVDHPLDGLGFLVPSGEKRSLNGAQFCSTMFPGRAPKGYVAVAAYFGGARSPALGQQSVETLTDLARAELGDLIGARGTPVVARVRHWPRGLPQYYSGHAARITKLVAATDARPGLFLVGNYLRGPSVAECVTLALETSAKVDRFLASTAAGAKRYAVTRSKTRRPVNAGMKMHRLTSVNVFR